MYKRITVSKLITHELKSLTEIRRDVICSIFIPCAPSYFPLSLSHVSFRSTSKSFLILATLAKQNISESNQSSSV